MIGYDGVLIQVLLTLTLMAMVGQSHPSRLPAIWKAFVGLVQRALPGRAVRAPKTRGMRGSHMWWE